MSRTPKDDSSIDSSEIFEAHSPVEFSERITPHLRKLIKDHPDGPVARQFVVDDRESVLSATELEDPLGELANSPAPRLVRKYTNRALLLATDTCAAHCRYCFRRSFTASGHGIVTDEQLADIGKYLGNATDIDELLISGGDPLTVPVTRLRFILETIRASRSDIVMRICTRVPIVAPHLMSRYAELLRDVRPVWMVVQINHPDELHEDVVAGLKCIIDSGIPVISQTVLLRGINDSTSILEDLFNRLVKLQIQPYQLFQADLVPRTSHYRVPLKRGVELYESLRNRISTLALPIYSVDAPGGGGKINLGTHSLVSLENGYFLLRGADGNTYRYPDESEGSTSE